MRSTAIFWTKKRCGTAYDRLECRKACKDKKFIFELIRFWSMGQEFKSWTMQIFYFIQKIYLTASFRSLHRLAISDYENVIENFTFWTQRHLFGYLKYKIYKKFRKCKKKMLEMRKCSALGLNRTVYNSTILNNTNSRKHWHWGYKITFKSWSQELKYEFGNYDLFLNCIEKCGSCQLSDEGIINH